MSEIEIVRKMHKHLRDGYQNTLLTFLYAIFSAIVGLDFGSNPLLLFSAFAFIVGFVWLIAVSLIEAKWTREGWLT